MKVVFLVGPTASGKSALALELAEKTGGAILNSDSVQVYQDLQIGSAAPSAEDKIRVPHFLFQFVPAPQKLTAGDYSRLALEKLAVLKNRYPVVFVTGGTGFYLLALEKGMLPVPKADFVLQAEIEAQLAEPGGPQALHAELVRLDPRVAQRISVADHYRLTRALEIIRGTGRPLSAIEDEHKAQQNSFPYPLLKLGTAIEKDLLRTRVEIRTRHMLQQGLVAEVEGLLSRGFRDWDPLASVGYKETVAFLEQKFEDQTQLEQDIIQNTVRLTKKQRTWFQKDPQIWWGNPQDPQFFLHRLAAFLGS